jgi:hypothetical protein
VGLGRSGIKDSLPPSCGRCAMRELDRFTVLATGFPVISALASVLVPA